jgi:hypothetical protein
VVDSLKIVDEQSVRSNIEELVAGRALDASAGDQVSLTTSGQELLESIQSAGGEIASRLYADISREDLEAGGRVLTLILERANAELAVA